MTKNEKGTCAPLCRTHYTEMRSSVVWRLDPVSYDAKEIPSFRRVAISRNWTYSLSIGYYRFREGEPIGGEESLGELCPRHRHPLWISEYDRQVKIEVWRCPEPGCETIKKRRAA